MIEEHKWEDATYRRSMYNEAESTLGALECLKCYCIEAHRMIKANYNSRYALELLIAATDGTIKLTSTNAHGSLRDFRDACTDFISMNLNKHELMDSLDSAIHDYIEDEIYVQEQIQEESND